jgi:MYXO-CTERM domain-containing protein
MGKCVAEAPVDPEKSVSSGSCSHSMPGPSRGWIPLLLFVAAAISLRRRHRYAKFSLDLTDREWY